MFDKVIVWYLLAILYASFKTKSLSITGTNLTINIFSKLIVLFILAFILSLSNALVNSSLTTLLIFSNELSFSLKLTFTTLKKFLTVYDG